MSMLNPGTSINFDGHDLEEQAEAELDKEDQRCQQELRDLLSTALPDDLLDDESSSLSSSSLSHDKNSSPEPWQDDGDQHEQQRPNERVPEWMDNLERLRNNLQHGLHQQQLQRGLHQQQQTSTPQGGGHLPPLKTPAAYQEYDYFHGAQNGNGFSVPNKGTNIELQRYDSTDMEQGDRGEVEGADSDHDYDNQEVHRNKLPHQIQSQEFYMVDALQRKPSQDYNSDSVAYTTCTENDDYDEQQYGDVSQHEYQNGGKYEHGFAQNGVNHVHGVAQNGVNHNGISQRHEYQNGGKYAQHENGVAQNGIAKTAIKQQHYGAIGDVGHTNHAGSGKEYLIDQNGSEAQQVEHKTMPRHTDGINGNSHDYNPQSSIPRQVQYKGDGADDLQQNGHLQQNGSATHHDQQQRGEISSSHGSENGAEQKRFRINPLPGSQVTQGNVQEQYLQTVNSEHSRQLAQLEILYKAKSRELEQVNSQLETLKEESAREKRILNHQLAMISGEKEGASANFEQSRELLVSCQQEKMQLEEQYQTQSEQINTLTASQEGLMEKLQTAQCTIDNLAQQLQAVQMGDPHSKFGRDREDLLASIQEKNQEEVNMYRYKLDKLTKAGEERDMELKTLQEQLNTVRKTLDQTRVEHGDVVNKLSRSLEESQAQCRQYLESGSFDEIGQLKLELKQTSTARNMSQDMCKSLQEELEDLKEQVQMYESAASLGVMSSTISPRRNLNKEDWETPKMSRSDVSSTNDEMIKKLRQELDKALVTNRTKRTQVKHLQDELKSTKKEYESKREEVEEAQFQMKDLQVQMQLLRSQSGGQLSGPRLSLGKKRVTICVGAEEGTGSRTRSIGEVDRRMSIGSIEARRNTTELGSLKDDCEALKNKLEKKVEENVELKQQMMQMVGEHDEDKQSTLDRVQNTCIQLHEDRSKQMRENLVSEWDSERDMLKEAHQHQLQELKVELEAVQKELCDVKEDYVRVCEEKNQIEDDVTKKLNCDAEIQLTKKIEELSTAKEKALEDLKLSLENGYRVQLMNAKTEWEKESKEQAETDLQIKLSDARVEWYATARKQAAESVKQALEAEWQTKLDSEVETKLTERLIQAKKELERKHKEDKDEECRRIQTSCEEKHRIALQTALTKAESDWQEKLHLVTKQKVQEAMKECNQKWLAGDTNARQLVDERVAEERAKWLKETVDWEEIRTTWMDKEGTSLIEKEVAQVTDELNQKHCEELAALENKYENLDCGRRNEMKKETKKLDMERENFLQEHKEFLREHTETMTKAIQAAKMECEKEKVELFHQKSLEFEQNLVEKERHWEEEKQNLIDRLQQTKGKNEKAQQQSEEELLNLRQQLRTSRDELQQTEDSLKHELKHLQSQLTSSNSATMEALEGRMTEMQRKHSTFVSKLKEQHAQEKLEWNAGCGDHGNVQSVCQTVQTDPEDDLSSRNGLNELRSHYLSTVEKIRSDVLKYVTDMREQCRRTVHEEVKKERNVTAKKLRQYYLRCLHQLMEEDKSGGSATLNKFIAMATALELPECNVDTKDKPSTHSKQDNRSSSSHGSRCSSRQSSRSSSPSEMGTRHDPSQRRPDSRASSIRDSRGSSRQSSRSSSPLEVITHHDSPNRNQSAFKPITKPSPLPHKGHNDTATGHSTIRTRPNKEQFDPNKEEFKEHNSYQFREILESETFRLSRQPREFNPSPERLQPDAQSSITSRSLSVKHNSVDCNITVRHRKVIESDDDDLSLVKDARNMKDMYAKTSDRHADSVYVGPIREYNPKNEKQSYKSTSNTDYKTNYHRISDDQKHVPRTNISSASLATEYNELPDSLDIGDECPQDIPKSRELKDSHTSGRRNNVPYNDYKDRIQLGANSISVKQSTSSSSSNRMVTQGQENIMFRSHREKLIQDGALSRTQRSHSRQDISMSGSQSEMSRSRQDVSKLKNRQENVLSKSQGDRSRQDMSKSYKDTSRQNLDTSRQSYTSRRQQEKTEVLLRSQRDGTRQAALPITGSNQNTSRQDYVSRLHAGKSNRDASRQELVSRVYGDESGDDIVVLKSNGDRSKQDKDVVRTQVDSSRPQSGRSGVSQFSSSILGASKRYKTSRYQDSGFDSPNIE